MSTDEPAKPTLTPRARREANDRRLRQARALRANLLRRKARHRAGEDTAADPPGALENKDDSINTGDA